MGCTDLQANAAVWYCVFNSGKLGHQARDRESGVHFFHGLAQAMVSTHVPEDDKGFASKAREGKAGHHPEEETGWRLDSVRFLRASQWF